MRSVLLVLTCLTAGACAVWAFGGAALLTPGPAPFRPSAGERLGIGIIAPEADDRSSPSEAAPRPEPRADGEPEIEDTHCGG